MAAPAKTLASIAAPAPVVAQAAPAAKVQNAKEKAAIDRGLTETRVESVRVDGLALMKIIKHSREAHTVLPAPAGTSNATVSFAPAVGQLLGIDSDGVLEISNSFALPSGALGGSATDGDERGSKAAANKYTSSLLPRLADLNADASLVGFYVSANNGQQLAIPGFIEALVGAQLAGGGLGSGAPKAQPVGRSAAAKPQVPTQASTNGKGIALVFDIASTAQGGVGLKAFRLTDEFVNAYRAGKFDTASLIEHKLVPSNILVELPVTVRSSPLLTAFLSTLYTSPSADLPLASFSSLSLPPSSSTPASLSTPLSALISSLDTHQAHLSTLSFQSRQLARDRARLDSIPSVVRRRQENEQRAKEGLPLLPPAPEEAALVEPSRLETMCALNGVDGAAKVLSEATGVALVRSYAAKAGTVA
ncbi:hypothetical protein MNV49_007942 [Pseudohyphozyma bogoriensis]|nr:hypothetical protein MNV49_007942 [Pseudohyphozyma bogoriensis]